MTHHTYNTHNFPTFVCHHGNWDIYRDAKGYCAAIPVKQGCNATHFGDAAYVRATLGLDVFKASEYVEPDSERMPLDAWTQGR